jgi:3-dehydroquinate dehydratase-2
MLGTREPEKYGTLTLSEIVNRLGTEAASLNVDLDHFQSNAEYALIDRIHQAKDNVDYILINPAAFTHTSVAIRDALLAVSIPFIEIHLSNVHARSRSVTIRICRISPLALSADWVRTVIHTLYRQR